MSPETSEIGRPRPDRAIVLIWLLSLVCLLAPAGLFMKSQCLWVDEVTQLSGLTLGPAEQARWLAGADPERFGVPADRMPPMSYWVGGTWAAAFGLTEASLRWMGLLFTAGAALLVVSAAGRLAGRLGAAAAGLIFSLSPNVIVTAVEIRAYPLFMLASAAGLFPLLRVVPAPAPGGRRG